MIKNKYHAWLVMTIALLGLASPAYSFDYFVDYPRDKDGKSITSRAVISGGTYKLTVKSSDYSTYPGQDSGPRCEVRIKNDYTSGTKTFEANVKIATGTQFVSIFQIFCSTPWQIRFKDNLLSTAGYDGSQRNGISGTIDYGTTFKLKTVHNADTKKVTVYINGVEKLSQKLYGYGSRTHYFKFGPYGRPGMGATNTITYSSVSLK